MPYKCPRKRREANRQAQARWRERQKAAKGEPLAPPVAVRGSTPTRKRQEPAALPGPLPGRLDYTDLPEWAARNLTVPAGRLEGKPFNFPDWQKRFTYEAFQPSIIEAGFSLARKQGKTGYIAGLCLFDCMHAVNHSIVVTSEKAHFAGLMREAIKKIADVSGLGEFIVQKTSPLPGRILAPNGNTITFLAADKGNPGQAEAANLAIIDECGLLDENQRELYNSMQSAISTTDGAFLSIGTQKQGPMFREQRTRANLDGRAFHLYTTPMDYKIDDPEGWAMSNPSLGGIKSLDYMKKQIERAKESPEDELFVRSDDLNQPIQIKQNMIMTVGQWERVVESKDEKRREGPVVVAFDFGGATSMTAATALWPATGRVEAFACFPAFPDLDTRGRQDQVGKLYIAMEQRGEIWILGHELSDIPEFVKRVLRELDGENIVAFGADFYKKKDFQQVLIDAEIQHIPLIFRGTFAGAREGAFDIRSFQRRAINGPLFIARGKLLLTTVFPFAVLAHDTKGNPALDKSNERRRIDPISALVIACGIGETVEIDAGNPSIMVA